MEITIVFRDMEGKELRPNSSVNHPGLLPLPGDYISLDQKPYKVEERIFRFQEDGIVVVGLTCRNQS